MPVIADNQGGVLIFDFPYRCKSIAATMCIVESQKSDCPIEDNMSRSEGRPDFYRGLLTSARRIGRDAWRIGARPIIGGKQFYLGYRTGALVSASLAVLARSLIRLGGENRPFLRGLVLSACPCLMFSNVKHAAPKCNSMDC
jgi:hypothetical protein